MRVALCTFGHSISCVTKRLSKEHCSGIARLYFDQIHEFKDLISVGSLPAETPLDACAAIEEWLPRVLRALKGSVVNRNENPLFHQILQGIRQTRDDLPGLILAVQNIIEERITIIVARFDCSSALR
jgi:hypothetical protein